MLPRSFLIILIALLVVACTSNNNTPTPVAPTDTPVKPTVATAREVTNSSSSLSTNVTALAENSPINDPILIACSANQQVLPFRDDLVPDLVTLGIHICYDLQFTLNEASNGFDGFARVTVRNGSSDRWPDLLFRLYPHSPFLFGGQIEVGTVKVDGTVVDATRTLADETGLRVPLAAPLSPGENVEVEIPFSGQLTEKIGGHKKVYGVFARTESAVTIASWFPLLAVWNNIADKWFDVQVIGEGDAVFAESAFIQAKLSAPEQFDLAVSGTIIDEQHADGRATYQVVTGPARELTMTWLEGYQKGEMVVDGTVLRNWFRPGHEEGATRAMDAARQSIVIFNEQFGPYPFEEVDIVEVPLAGAGGVEYPQLYLLDQGLYQNSSSHDFLAFASSHEMAHQWWYSTIGNDINAAPWQDEALTNWSALLWLESLEDGLAKQYINSYEQSVERYQQKAGEEAINQSLKEFSGRTTAYATIVYLKGALFFNALRQEIGDDAYFKALQSYYADKRFAIAVPSDLLTRFEQTSGRELADFYEEWGVWP